VVVVQNSYLSARAALTVTRDWESPSFVATLVPNRALGLGDMTTALPGPVVGTIRWDDAIARAVDAGILITRLPTNRIRGLSQLAHDLLET
jgi:hypothetical protein